MATIEVNGNGDLVLPAEVLGSVAPHAQFEVQVSQGTVILVPVNVGETPLWERSPEEQVKSFLEWANTPRPPAPEIPLEALRRENLY